MENVRRGRIDLIDALRGFAVFMMLFHHLAINLEWQLGLTDFPLIHEDWFFLLQLPFLLIFFGISGICSQFSKSNIKRGLVTLAAAFAVSLVSFFVFPEAPIYFGVLHMLGTSMLVYGLLQKPLAKIPSKVSFSIFSLLFLILYVIYLNMPRIAIPHLYLFGLPDYSFASSDYYPILPWIFLFLAGTALGKPIREGKFPKWFYEVKIPFFSAIGRHALWIYLFHQPVFYLLFQIFLPLFT